MPRYEQGSNRGSVSLRVDSGGGIDFQRDAGGGVDVYLRNPHDERVFLTHLGLDRLRHFLAALETIGQRVSDDSPPRGEVNRYDLLEID